MNPFFIKLALRTCYFMGSVLWGIMTFLQCEKSGKATLTIFDSIESFRNEFNILDECDKKLNWVTLNYDNIFVLFGGLFLILYAAKLKNDAKETKRKGSLTDFLSVLLVLGTIYMILDWSENYCLFQAIKYQDFKCSLFKPLQLLKWGTGIFTLVSLIIIDWRFFRNWRGILWGTFGFLLIMLLITQSLHLYHKSHPVYPECKI